MASVGVEKFVFYKIAVKADRVGLKYIYRFSINLLAKKLFVKC